MRFFQRLREAVTGKQRAGGVLGMGVPGGLAAGHVGPAGFAGCAPTTCSTCVLMFWWWWLNLIIKHTYKRVYKMCM